MYPIDLRRIFKALVPRLVLPSELHARASASQVRPRVEEAPHEDAQTSVAEPTTPASKPPPSLDSRALTRGLGLRIDPQDRRRVHRAERSHMLDAPLPPDGEDLDLEARAHWTSELLTARYILDHQLATWRPELERPDPRATPAYQKKDVPSSYGERLPRLVPSRTRVAIAAYLEEHQEQTLIHQPLTEELDIIFTLEVGKYQHVMTEEDAASCQLPRDQIIADARYMLFYQSYKLKPVREQMPFGKIRHHVTREGLGATRAILLPDFDIDAARERGFALIVSRDHLVVIEPSSPEHREEARQWCVTQHDALRLEERYIYPRALFELDLDGITAIPCSP